MAESLSKEIVPPQISFKSLIKILRHFLISLDEAVEGFLAKGGRSGETLRIAGLEVMENLVHPRGVIRYAVPVFLRDHKSMQMIILSG